MRCSVSGGTRLGLTLLGAAFLQGVLGDVLFHGVPLGLNVPLWVASFVVCLVLLLRVSHAPLVALFGGLFVAADVIFQRLLGSVVPSPLAPVRHALLVLLWAWVSAGLLRDLVAPRDSSAPAARPRPRLGIVEIGTALALLDLLFLAFVAVQFRYLFGGRGLVESRTHLTYAQYARHGFFELVAVAALVLPLLLLADWALRRERRRDHAVFAG